jgi:transcriptional regulator with XRE-family HTH domain
MLVNAIKRLEAEMLAAGVPKRKVRSTMASICGLQPQSVHAWFQGATKQPSAEHIMAIADFYGLSYKWVITGKGEKRSLNAESDQEALLLDLLRGLPPHLRKIALRQIEALAESDQ